MMTNTKRRIRNINTVMKMLFKKKEYEALIKRLMSMNFKQNSIQYVIGILTSCGENDIIGKIK